MQAVQGSFGQGPSEGAARSHGWPVPVHRRRPAKERGQVLQRRREETRKRQSQRGPRGCAPELLIIIHLYLTLDLIFLRAQLLCCFSLKISLLFSSLILLKNIRDIISVFMQPNQELRDLLTLFQAQQRNVN